MEHKKTLNGIIIFFVFVMFGGLVGIFGGNLFIAQAQTEELTVVKQVEEVAHEVIEEQEEVLEALPAIEILNLNDLHHALDIWREIFQRTAQGQLTHKEAGKLIYTMSSEMYKRNIPEELILLRFKNIIVDNGKGQLKELKYLNFTYDGEAIVYIDVEENYENDTCCYKLKFVNENNKWCFAAQLDK